jgi:hypothetical protein
MGDLQGETSLTHTPNPVEDRHHALGWVRHGERGQALNEVCSAAYWCTAQSERRLDRRQGPPIGPGRSAELHILNTRDQVGLLAAVTCLSLLARFGAG